LYCLYDLSVRSWRNNSKTRVRKETWNEIAARLIPGATCVLCEDEPAKELAHMPRHKRDAGAKFHKYIDVEEDAVPIGFDCKEFSETHKGRIIAVAWLREKFGKDHWNNWYDNLPFKIKDKY